MKKYITIFCLLLLLCLTESSCKKDFLDKAPLDQLSDQSFWKTEDDAVQFSNSIYRYIPQGDLFVLMDAFTDNAIPVHVFADQGKISMGTADATTGWFRSEWRGSYAAIRRCNVLLQNIGTIPMNEQRKSKIIAQTKFLRAYFYQYLMKLFGGVPIIEKPLELNEQVPVRKTVEEVGQFIVSELTAASNVLDLAYSNSSDVGRPTKGAAIALKANVLLYLSKFAEAAIAAKEVMDLNQYQLYQNGYGQLFMDENNEEVIFDKQYMKDKYGDARDEYFLPSSFGSYSAMSPTQDFVDEYECVDGKPIKTSPLYDKSNPFKNRDPRLEASILYNGSVIGTTTIDTYNGEDAYLATANSTRTGYYLRKYLNPDNGGGGLGDTWTNFILIRYAEVLLTYAEAKNEVSGPDQSIYGAVDMVRVRAGLPKLPAGLTKEQMREAVRHERRVEFAFEGLRIFDIRRLRIAEKVMIQPVLSQPMPTPAGTPLVVETRSFNPERDYLWAIPQGDIDLSKGTLKQNPNY